MPIYEPACNECGSKTVPKFWCPPPRPARHHNSKASRFNNKSNSQWRPPCSRPVPFLTTSSPTHKDFMNNEDLQAELDTLIATQAGLMAIIGSLMATHPDYEKFQLHLTGLLEVLLTGNAGKTFTSRQRQQARDFVQMLQNINKAPAKIEPLASIANL